MRKFYQKLGAMFLIFVMVVGLVNALPICRVQAANYPSVMIEGIPYYPQKLSGVGDCGISSIAMIEAYALGYDSSCFDAVYDGVMLANGKSLNIGDAVHNGKYRDISKDLGTIYSELTAGRPVLIYRMGSKNHWSVIVGYNGSTSTLQKSGFIVYNTMYGKKPGDIETDNLENWLNGYTWSHAKVRSSGAISGITTSVSTLTLEITYPENVQVGKGVASTGLLISAGNITEVNVVVKTTGGKECFRAPTERPNSKYYTLLTQDANMKFGSLSVGNYLYCVSAKDSTGATLNWEQQFTVSNSSTSFKKVVSQGAKGTQTEIKKVEAAGFTGTDVANYAKQFIDKSYVEGASGPNAFDCSGLVKYVYAHFDVDLPHGTGYFQGDACCKYGTKITDKWQLQAGDLVFFGSSNNDLGHVGIYLGDGLMISALSGESMKVLKGYIDSEMSKTYGGGHGTWSGAPFQFGIRVIDGGNGSTGSPVENSNIFSSVRAENITATSAKIIADYAKDTYGDVGFYFGSSSDLAAMTKVSEYKYSSITEAISSNNSYQIGVYYDDTYKYKWWPVLTPGTIYYYAFFCVKNGTEYISNIQSFITVGNGDSAFPLINGGIYKICSALSGQAMGVCDGDTSNGRRVSLWPYGNASWMQWEAVWQPDGYSFLNVSTKKALDISDGSAEEKAVLQQWDYCDVDAQRFKLTDQGNGKYGLLAKCSGLAVDVVSSKITPGAKLAQYAFNGKDNQLWYFEPVDREAPDICNVRVTDVDSTGYTILCDVMDSSGVARVVFPTWTEAKGQDDLVPDWRDSCAVFVPSYGNTYAYRVNISAHNNEHGVYLTLICAYDVYGCHSAASEKMILP